MTEEKKAIKYLKNNNGVIRKEKFLEDFDPIGEKLIDQLVEKGKVETDTLPRSKATVIILLNTEG